MTEPENARVFGKRVPDAAYISRPSVYAVIRNEQREVAVLRTTAGIFLPGGGIHPEETAEQALHREVREECGLAIRILEQLPSAVQLIYSQAELTYFEKTSAFFSALADSKAEPAVEQDHQLLWISHQAATSLLAHESHQWACTTAAASRLSL